MAKKKTKQPQPAAGYLQISVALEDGIRSGRFPPDSAFPSESELMKDFGVSRLTIRRALERLAAEGMIHRYRGRGSFVSSAIQRKPLVLPFGQSQVDATSNVDLEFISRSTTAMTPTLRKLFGPDKDDLVEEFVGVRSIGHDPVSLIVKYLPRWAAALVPVDDEYSGFLTMYDVLNSHGVIQKRVHQSVGAQTADPMIAARLGVKAGSPVLRFTRIFYDQRKRPFVYTRGFFRADKFEYDMEFVDGEFQI